MPALFSAMAQYQTQSNKDPYANLIMQSFITNATIGAFINMVYLKPEVSPAAFSPFYSIPTVGDTTKLQTLTEMISGQIVPSIPRYRSIESQKAETLAANFICRVDWFTTTLKPTASLYSKVENVLKTAPELQTLTSLTAGAMALAIQPISATVAHTGHRRGGNALGLQATAQTWFTLDVSHYSSTDDEAAHNATRGVLARIESVTKSDKKYLPYQFMNDASFDQDVIEHYGAANVRKLKAVQERYDPKRVFQTLVPGGFKLP